MQGYFLAMCLGGDEGVVNRELGGDEPSAHEVSALHLPTKLSSLFTTPRP